MSKSVLTLDDINLLINSEEPKNIDLYGNLYTVLCNIRNLKAVSLEQLPTLNNKAKAALTYNKKTFMDTVIKEWYAERVSEVDPSKKVRCGLCNTPNKYLFYIKNRKNEKVLNVGSHCITKFPGIEGYIEQKKQLNQIYNGHKIIVRRNEFYEHFPDCEDLINDCECYFSSLPVLIPYNLYTKLQDTIIRMRKIFTLYVNEGKKPFNSEKSSIELFQLAIELFNKTKNQADIFVSQNKDKKLICKRQEIDWMIETKRLQLLQQIAEDDGIYTQNTLCDMCSIDFIKSFSNSIFSKNQSKVFAFEKFDGKTLVFAFNKFGYQPPILFSVNIKDFMQYIGAKCIYYNNFTYGIKDIMLISNILNSKRNLTSILGYIDDIMNLLNCVFLFDESVNNLYLYRKGDRAVRLFSINAFVQNYSKYILLSDDEIKKYLISVVKGRGSVKWATLEIQAKQGIEDKIGMLYKNYKDSHEYNIRPTKQIFELMTYSVYNDSVTYTTKIDFNSPEYISLQRNQLKLGKYQLDSVDYGLRINDESLSPVYHDGDLLFIQSIQKFKKDAIIFFATNDRMIIKRCHSESGEPESIFNFINISKRELIAFGKIVYCLHNKSQTETEQIVETQQEISLNKVKIFVTSNPRCCFECSSKCTYKLIEYIQENKKSRKINVAVCPKCNKYYIDRNSYLNYIKNKKETNLAFVLSE